MTLCRHLACILVAFTSLVANAGPPASYVLKVDERPLSTQSLGVFRVGMRVSLAMRNQVIPPLISGHAKALAFGPGQAGIITRFFRKNTFGPMNSAVVRFDKQQWEEWETSANRMVEGKLYTGAELWKLQHEPGNLITMPAFEWPVPLGMLNLLEPDGAKGVRVAVGAIAAPEHIACEPGEKPIPDKFTVYVRRDVETKTATVALTLGKASGATITDVWPELRCFTVVADAKALAVLMTRAEVTMVQNFCQ